MVVSLILVMALAAALWAIGNARCFALVGEMVCRVETDRPMVALTFDDGPTRALQPRSKRLGRGAPGPPSS